MLKKRFREYFTFTKKERNGIVVLLSILFILVLVRIYQSYRPSGDILLMSTKFSREIETFEKGLQLAKEQTKSKSAVHDYKKAESEDKWIIPSKLFKFDPNTVSKAELQDLGFSNKQLSTLLNYRKSGGRFFNSKDLLKIYGIDIKQYRALEPYILIDKEDGLDKKETDEKNELALIELNSSTKDGLIKLKGIGDSYAERIIKYRSLLGGYYTPEQLLEVYGMDSVRYSGFCNQIIIDTTTIHKIDLNTASFDSLIRHPYLNIYQTKAILKYKEIVGDFSNMDQIYQNNLLTKEEFLQLRPYLKLK